MRRSVRSVTDDTDVLVNVLELAEIEQTVETVQSAQARTAIAAGLGFGEKPVVVVDPDGAIAQGTRQPP